MSGRRTAKPILVLQHIGCEPPAAYGDELGRSGVPLNCVRLDEGEELPDWQEHSAIVVMGGPMGVHDEELHRWLGPEKRLIAEAVRAGMPYWGVCLGAQLLAAALGAGVTRGPQPEVGVLAVRLTDAAARDPVFALAPPVFPAFHWHSDTYELPDGAVHLARSESYEQQAFVWGNAYALQFHIEVTPTLVAEWGRVPAYADSLERARAALPRIVDEVAAVEADSVQLARELCGRWLQHVVGVPSAAAA